MQNFKFNFLIYPQKIPSGITYLASRLLPHLSLVLFKAKICSAPSLLVASTKFFFQFSTFPTVHIETFRKALFTYCAK